MAFLIIVIVDHFESIFFTLNYCIDTNIKDVKICFFSSLILIIVVFFIFLIFFIGDLDSILKI